MPDVPVPDIHQAVADRGHESLRRSVVVALDNLADQIDRMERAFLLLLGTAQGLQGTLNQLAALQQNASDQAGQISTLQTQVADLQTRVAALEAAQPTTA